MPRVMHNNSSWHYPPTSFKSTHAASHHPSVAPHPAPFPMQRAHYSDSQHYYNHKQDVSSMPSHVPYSMGTSHQPSSHYSVPGAQNHNDCSHRDSAAKVKKDAAIGSGIVSLGVLAALGEVLARIFTA